jgi:hypothetical protein
MSTQCSRTSSLTRPGGGDGSVGLAGASRHTLRTFEPQELLGSSARFRRAPVVMEVPTSE